MAPRYKLKLKQLDFISLVDDPAQPNAKCLLIKRKGGDKSELEGTARLVKTVDELGLAFFWAFTSTNPDGTDHHDLHGDAVLADNAMIKAAAEFMEKGGAVDEMHDEDPDGGRVVFAMPMTPEIAKAFGVTTKTSGLMIAIKPSVDAMAKLKDGTYRAVSIAGLGERETVKQAKVAKGSLFTNEVDGHQHRICVYEDGSMWVDHATMTDAQYSHSHGIVFEDGKLTILADSGHTHELAEGQGGVVVVPQDSIVLVQASVSPTTNARGAKVVAAKSTRPAVMPQRGLTSTEKSQMPDQNESKIADLEKQVARLSKIAKLSGAQKSHFDTLSADDAEAFLAKSNTERDSAVAEVSKRNEEADKVVYVSKSTGDVYRAKDDARLVEMAKRMDDQAQAIEKSNIRKQAAEVLGGMPGADDAHDLIVRSLTKSGAKQEEIDAAFAVLKGMKATSSVGKSAPGFGGTEPQTGDAGDALTALEKGLKAFAKAQNITKNVWTDGLNAFVKTDEGAALKRAYDESRAT